MKLVILFGVILITSVAQTVIDLILGIPRQPFPIQTIHALTYEISGALTAWGIWRLFADR